MLDAPPGLEPGLSGSEPAFLPLEDGAIYGAPRKSRTLHKWFVAIEPVPPVEALLVGDTGIEPVTPAV